MIQSNSQPSYPGIGAVVMAAGLSQRMGEPKMLLPWGNQTVIEKVVSTLLSTEVEEVVVVTGGVSDQIKTILSSREVRVVFNPNYADGVMLNSLRTGLTTLNQDLDAALIALGDNPQIEEGVVEKIISEYKNVRSRLIVPSYDNRRGHPWLVDKSLWQPLIQWDNQLTLRDFLNFYKQDIHYLKVDSASVLMDLDTPDDYQKQRPDFMK
ncbi:MAG: nucleotidyltransferase family protein [Anaerolineaceae bacterium]|nr:nucleotidyltransferase family protein [Anaerolineaceae bacterium]